MSERVAQLAAPVRVLVVCPARPPCPQCSGHFAVELDVSGTGYTCGSTFMHTDTCPDTMCPHGKKWKDWAACAECDAEAEGEATDE